MSQAILLTGDCRAHSASIVWCFSTAVSTNADGSRTAEISKCDLKVYLQTVYVKEKESHTEKTVSFL